MNHIILNNIPLEYQQLFAGKEHISFDLLKNIILSENKKLEIKNYKFERETSLNNKN